MKSIFAKYAYLKRGLLSDGISKGKLEAFEKLLASIFKATNTSNDSNDSNDIEESDNAQLPPPSDSKTDEGQSASVTP